MKNALQKCPHKIHFLFCYQGGRESRHEEGGSSQFRPKLAKEGAVTIDRIPPFPLMQGQNLCWSQYSIEQSKRDVFITVIQNIFTIFSMILLRNVKLCTASIVYIGVNS